MGSRLRVSAERESGAWLFVLAPDGYEAWARGWGTCAEEPGVEGDEHVFVDIPMAMVRRDPSAFADPVTPVWMGSRLRVVSGSSRGWRAVATPDGRRGWIKVTSITADPRAESGGFWDPSEAPEPDPAAVAEFDVPKVRSRARSLLGFPYRWGGTTPAGFDCSGFIRLILGLEGIRLPRDARDQEKALRPWQIDEDDFDPARLRAGEIVFFGPSSGHAIHVGIGIGGRPGRFIHSTGRVRISSLAPGDLSYEEDLAGRVRSVIRLQRP
jgi:gamma-D-glutamyl-L-lysine dipeptidyl-peptidase